MKNFLSDFPGKETILEWYSLNGSNVVHEVNGHIHSPYSFSSFNNLNHAFQLAVDQNISILGINDFYTTRGYEEFQELSTKFRIFPLFNIEFMGLIRDFQKEGIRINDPVNPGRIYLSGKGLDFPVSLSGKSQEKIERLLEESLSQTRQMVEKASALLQMIDPDLSLDFDEILQKYTMGMVRERHIARVIRIKLSEKYPSVEDLKNALKRLYGGKETSVDINHHSALENEIRNNILKSGGSAFVPEDPKAFLELDEIIRIIIDSGGIPCYPVLLDDAKGYITDFEKDYELLYHELSKRKIFCIELIPGRNDFHKLKEFVYYFQARNFIILFGTEHNTPDLIPLKVNTRGGFPLDEELKIISFEGACVTAAHQYLRAMGEEGFLEKDGTVKTDDKEEFIELGNAVIEYFIQNPG
jgi:hypothetical protein